MSANEMATTSVKKLDSDLERAADTWTEHAEIMATAAKAALDLMERQMSREYAKKEAYARGRAEGLRQALRLLGREVA